MPTCQYCQAALNAKVRTCPHCDNTYPIGRPVYAFPSIIVSFLTSCVICWVYLKTLGGLAWWQAAIITLPAVLLLFTVTIQLASSWDHQAPRR